MPRTELSDQILREMRKYTDDVKKQIEINLDAVSDQALQKIRHESPRHTGKYARGWRLSKVSKDGSLQYTIRQSKSKAALTHLLEKGHRTRNKKSWVKAQPHIAAVEEWAASAAEKAVEKAVEG